MPETLQGERFQRHSVSTGIVISDCYIGAGTFAGKPAVFITPRGHFDDPAGICMDSEADLIPGQYAMICSSEKQASELAIRCAECWSMQIESEVKTPGLFLAQDVLWPSTFEDDVKFTIEVGD